MKILFKKSAFTLIELLIAASIFSVVLVSFYSLFHTGIISYNKTDASFEAYQRARIIFSRMEKDFSNCFIYSKADSRFKGSPDSAECLSVGDIYSAGPVHPGIIKVIYKFDNSVLQRIVYNGLESLKTDGKFTTEEIDSPVEKAVFEFANRTDSPENPYEWLDTWPKDQDQIKELPSAIRITLSLAERKNINNIVQLTKIIPIYQNKVSSESGGGTNE